MKVFRVLACVLFLMGCNSKLMLEPVAYKKWVDNEQNGLVKKKTINGVLFEAKYKPLEYVVAQELKGKDISEAIFNKTKKEFDGMDYFNLRISLEKSNVSIVKALASSDEDYFARKEYFYFNFDKSIFLEAGGVKYPCALYHFEETYELSRYETFVLAFKVDEKFKKESKTLIIDSEMFNTGQVKLRFESKDIENTPVLRLSNS